MITRSISPPPWKRQIIAYKIGIPILFEMNYTLYLCALCLCMKAQSLEALPLVALALSVCGVWFKDWFSKWRFCCIFHLAHQPASVNIQFRGTVLGSETFLGAEENSADVQSWQKSVTLSCEGRSLCYSVAALEVCTVKNEKGKAEIILVKYLLIVPYPLRLTFPSCPGANTGATPWSSPGMKIKHCLFWLLFHCPLPTCPLSLGCCLLWVTLLLILNTWHLEGRI